MSATVLRQVAAAAAPAPVHVAVEEEEDSMIAIPPNWLRRTRKKDQMNLHQHIMEYAYKAPAPGVGQRRV